MSARLPDRQLSNALLIGAAHFASGAIGDLPSVSNNVSALAEVLTDPVTGVVDPSRCRQLIDPRAQNEVGTALNEAVKSNARNLWMSVGRRTLPATLHVQGIE
ncbi:hypothetical protein, partial [Micromonospora sp. MH33]|uniref:hypothetical protein n=1 Tax=Micromonospora sp. MH33 TaxID=1945509 RepID=UPI001AEF37C8